MFVFKVTLFADGISNIVELSSFALSIVTTILSTLIIVIRILIVSRMPGASHQPIVAMEIIVESALLYSISALVYIAIIPNASAPAYYTYALLFFAYMAVESHHSDYSSLSPNSLSQNFAPILIMLRVLLGRARPDKEWSKSISNLQFNSTPEVQEGRSSRDQTHTILTIPRSHHEE
jgi:hypothetical protein